MIRSTRKRTLSRWSLNSLAAITRHPAWGTRRTGRSGGWVGTGSCAGTTVALMLASGRTIGA